jgi:tRNA (guanine-N7-)-methyltransferase
MTDRPPDHPDGRPWRNFYGRTRGKTLRPAQKGRLEGTLPTLVLPGVTREENPAREVLDLSGLSGPLWLEIGFGGGEHLVHMAGLYPGVTVLGAEPFVNGIAQFLGKLEAAGVQNIRLHPGDARDLLEVLPEGCLGRAFLNYPDPWPKARHHRRRFVNPEPLGLLARAMAPGAEFRVATDIEDYVRQTLEEVPPAGFALERGPVGEPWDDWTRTRYEAKAVREGREPHYMTFRCL